jgi:hypothetical protein
MALPVTNYLFWSVGTSLLRFNCSSGSAYIAVFIFRVNEAGGRIQIMAVFDRTWKGKFNTQLL